MSPDEEIEIIGIGSSRSRGLKKGVVVNIESTVALVIIDQGQIRVEPIKSGTASVLEKVAESIGKAAASGKGAKAEKTAD